MSKFKPGVFSLARLNLQFLELYCTSFGIFIRSRVFAISIFMGGKVQKRCKPEFQYFYTVFLGIYINLNNYVLKIE